MTRKTKEEALKTYHTLLDAAAELFSFQGIGQTTLNDIAKQAGMTRGAVYWHFANKDEVIQALWERDAAPVVDRLVNELGQLEHYPDSAGHFRNTLKAMLKAVHEDPKVSQAIRIVLNSSELTVHPNRSELQQFLDSKAMSIYRIIEHAVQTLAAQNKLIQGYAPTLMAGALWSYMHGLVDINTHSQIQAVDLRKDGDALLDLFLGNFLA